MPAPLDSATALSPSALTKALAQAALQRQNSLLGTGSEAGATALPAVPGAPAALPMAPMPVFALPAGVAGGTAPSVSPTPSSASTPSTGSDGGSRVTLSAQARQGLQSGLRDASAGPGLAAPAALGTAPGVSTPVWPAGGLSAPWQALAQSLVQQLTAHSAAPQRVAAAQWWPTGLAQTVEAGGSEVDSGLAPLQTWLVGQGRVQTPEGARTVALGLRVPVGWLAGQPVAAASASASIAAGQAPLQAAFAGPASGLQSGVLALVLQGAQGGGRTSALLSVEFQPLPSAQAAQVYGREVLQQQRDPWVHMALMEAQARRPHDALEREAQRDLCRTPLCPYAGRAACEQPFCVALRTVMSVAPAQALPAPGSPLT